MIGDILSFGLEAGKGIIGAIKRKRAKTKAKKALKKQQMSGGCGPGGCKIPSLPQGSTTTGSQVDSTKGGFEASPNKYSPQQQEALNYLLSQGRSRLENPYAGFEPIEQEARSKFKSESIPSLAERFTALGGSDTAGSSDFAGMLGGAQSEFDQGIAALRANYGLQNQDRALNLLNLGLTPQTEQVYFKGQEPMPVVPSTGARLFEQGAGIAGNLLENYLAGRNGGSSFGVGQPLSTRASSQQKQSITSNILNQNRLSSIGKWGQGGIKPGTPSTGTFAQAIALKRLQGGR